MIGLNGNKNYAYTTILYADECVAGAIVLADSIRKLGSLADLVVLITSAVSEEATELLKKFYDHIIKINDEDVTNTDFIKLNAFNLTQYKKVLLIKSESIILKYPDYLFTLTTPACIYLPDTLKYKEDGKNDQENKMKWFKKYCEYCSNGKLIPKSITDKMHKNNNFRILDGLLLLEPNKNEYNAIIKDLKNSKYTTEQYLIQKYSGMWISVEPIFLGYHGFMHWPILFGIQFSSKPFILESEIPLEERLKYEDLQLWYKYYSDIINRYPDLLASKAMKDANDISKYFIAPLSRKIIQFKKILSEGLEISVSRLFNIKNPKNYYYYHVNISKEYDNDEINYLFEDDFITNMINGILKKTNSPYWSNILKNINDTNNNIIDNTISNKINSKILNKFKTEDKENVLSYYTKINSNVCIILVITTTKNEENFWLNNNLITNILYQKDINLDGITLKNVLFNINQIYSYDERIKLLDSLYNNTTEYKIRILLYKTIVDCNLKGNNKDIYVFSDTNSKVRTLSVLLNDNTLNKFINRQIVFIPFSKTTLYKTVLENETYIKNMLMYQSLKKWIYNNYDGNEMDNIIIATDLKISDNKLIKNFVLIDTNYYNDLDDALFKNYEKKKLAFMNIIFTSKILKNSKIYTKYKNVIDNIHDLRHYYQVDGIKFVL